MSFETEKNKINKLNENQIELKTKVDRQSSKDSAIDQKIIKRNKISSIRNVNLDFSQDFEFMLPLEGSIDQETGEWYEASDEYEDQGIAFEIYLGQFDTKLLPYMKVVLLY
jgi:hypothetical protein